MHKRVLLSLFSLLLLFTAGAVVATLSLRHLTTELTRVVDLQSADKARHRLVVEARAVQAAFLARRLGEVDDAELRSEFGELRNAAAGCPMCHHPPALERRLAALREEVDDYGTVLVRYLEDPLSAERTDLARGAGELLVGRAETMAAVGSSRLVPVRRHALFAADVAQKVLLACLVVAVGAGIVICLRLANVLVEPVNRYLHQLRLQTRQDALTQLPNRSHLMGSLGRVIAHARDNPGTVFGVVLLDLDRFKVINDTLGHEQGDRHLVEIARHLKAAAREGDLVGRLAGDQFVVILRHVSGAEEAQRAGERFKEAVETPVRHGEQVVSANVSAGIVLSSHGFDRAEDLLRFADIAMYRAKTMREGVVVFDRDTDAAALQRLELEAGLHHVVERGELRLELQPIMALNSGRIDGLEALVRWQHPRRGLLGPNVFIPLAEEHGLMGPIGDWVLEESVRHMQALRIALGEHAPSFVSVNLSGNQLHDDTLPERIRDLLAEHELSAECIRLELTETALVENPNEAAVILQRIADLGIRVCLDDFGTGYSSLGYLDQFPIRTLKIDRSFVRQMGENGKTPEIVRTIVDLAKRLGIDVVVEGVEHDHQLEQTRRLDCEYVQGYLISRPLALSAVEELIASRTSELTERAA